MTKKIVLSVVAVVLVAALAVAGTLAWLTATSNDGEAIVNTFVSGTGLIDPPESEEPDPDFEDNGFYILEHVIGEDGQPTETLTDEGQTYTIIPGVDFTKDAFVKVVGKTDVEAYVFVEVVDGLATGLDFTMATGWTSLGVKGAHNGDVYAYTSTIAADVTLPLIADNTVTVSSTLTNSENINCDLAFYGYMCQKATFASAGAAWSGCFAN